MITIQLVNHSSHKFFTTCALVTSSTRTGKQGRQLDKISRGVALLGQGINRLGGHLDKNQQGRRERKSSCFSYERHQYSWDGDNNCTCLFRALIGRQLAPELHRRNQCHFVHPWLTCSTCLEVITQVGSYCWYPQEHCLLDWGPEQGKQSKRHLLTWQQVHELPNCCWK
jgi:hypothetical protein